MKKILFISSNDGYSWGGSEELWYAAALESANEPGFRTGICVAHRTPMAPKIAAIQNDSRFRFFFKMRRAPGVLEKAYNHLAPEKLRTKKSPRHMKDILRWNPDLVVISQGNNTEGVGLMEFCSQHQIPYTTIVQAVYEGQWPDTAFAERMGAGYSNALQNYFVSAANLNITELQIATTLANAKITRNPFSVPFQNDFAFPKQIPVQLACVGRFELFAKGQDVLLQVLSDQKWKHRPVTVNFYGSGGNERAIKNLIAHFGLPNARIRGHQTPTEIWKENAVLVLPSRFEGLPITLVEAMLCGRFGIVTNVSGNKEAIIDNVNGFIAEAPQAEYLDGAMEKAWQRKDDWETIGSNAKAYIKTLVPEFPARVFVTELKKFL